MRCACTARIIYATYLPRPQGLRVLPVGELPESPDMHGEEASVTVVKAVACTLILIRGRGSCI